MHFYSVYKQYLAFYAKLIPWEIYILRKIGAYQLIINGIEWKLFIWNRDNAQQTLNLLKQENMSWARL